LSKKPKKKAAESKPHDVTAVLKSGLRVASWNYVPGQPGDDYYEVVFDDGVHATLSPGDFGSLKRKGRVD
jgi:hypothetical protein